MSVTKTFSTRYTARHAGEYAAIFMNDLKGCAALDAMAWELVRLYGANGARARCSGEMLAAVEVETSRPERHCQNGRDEICLAGWQDGICCPNDSCDINDGQRYVTLESSGRLEESSCE